MRWVPINFPYLRRLSNTTDRLVAHNAGLPNAFGAYDQTPEEMRDLIQKYLDENSQYYWRVLWFNS